MIGIDMTDLVTLYEYGRVRRDGKSYVVSEPTPSSLAIIRRVIGCELPAYFVQFAKACPSYTSFFALLGDDLDACGTLYESHITVICEDAPDGYIPLAQRKWDSYILFRKSDPEGPIFNVEGPFLNPDDNTEIPEKIIEVAPSFRHYLEEYVIFNAIGPRTAEIGADNIRMLEEREKYVISVLKKYPGAAESLRLHSTDKRD